MPGIVFNDAATINDHIVLILTTIVPTVSAAASAAAAWMSVKFAIKQLTIDVGAVKKKQEIRVEKDEFLKLRLDVDSLCQIIQRKVDDSVCRSERSDCHQDRVSLNCEVSKQITMLVAAVNNQDSLRQVANDKNHEMFLKIMTALATVETSIKERERRFRSPAAEDLLQ